MLFSLALNEVHTFFSVSDDLVEKSQSCVTIHDLDALALTLLVDFSYTGEQFRIRFASETYLQSCTFKKRSAGIENVLFATFFCTLDYRIKVQYRT